MKVAYNACFGGFGLSPLATTEYAKKKGIELTWYKRVAYSFDKGGVDEYKRIEDVSKESDFGVCASKRDLGATTEKIPNEDYYYDGYSDEGRSDPDLIEVIERLGKAADGECASLSIVDIPNGASFEIDEYDGNETVVPPRQTW